MYFQTILSLYNTWFSFRPSEKARRKKKYWELKIWQVCDLKSEAAAGRLWGKDVCWMCTWVNSPCFPPLPSHPQFLSSPFSLTLEEVSDEPNVLSSLSVFLSLHPKIYLLLLLCSHFSVSSLGEEEINNWEKQQFFFLCLYWEWIPQKKKKKSTCLWKWKQTWK